MSKVTIVIPNWNGETLLEKNLPKVIAAKNNKDNKIKEVIVVDDASTDNSVALLKKKFSGQIRLIKHTRNRGFASAVNRGVRSSRTPLVCLLNTDVIPSRVFLKKTVPLFKKDVFAVGLHEKGYGPVGATFNNGFFEHFNRGEKKEVSESLLASGGSAVFSRKIWKELKGLDEDLLSPFYWEDTDISYRAWKRGYRILWDPNANVEHKHESVINLDNFSKKYLDIIKERNQILFTWKNITSRRLINRNLKHIALRTLRNPGFARVVLEALKLMPVLRKVKKKEKKYEKVSDEAIFAKFSK